MQHVHVENITNRQVGERIAKVRVEMKMTQADLASEMSARLGREFRPLTVTRLEGGKRPIGVDELVAVAEALSIKPADLLTDNLPMGSVYIMSAYQAVLRASNKLDTAVAQYDSACKHLNDVLDKTDDKHLDRLPSGSRIAIWAVRQLTAQDILEQGQKERSGQDDADA